MKKRKASPTKKANEKVEIAAGSIYEQLDFKNHGEMLTKANLVREITKAIQKKKLTQLKAADILGISQPKLSELLNGRFRGYSIERLIYFLTELGKDVDLDSLKIFLS